MYVSTRIRNTVAVLTVTALVLYCLVWLSDFDAGRDPQKWQAAQTVLDAERTIQAARATPEESAALSSDPIQAALLGPQTSQITTDPGSIQSKIAATNPNFAAAIVDMLRGAGVGQGDVVAVAYTGSFPMLDVAAIVAVESLGAEPVVVSSVGASNWGATDPAFTILDIESLLLDQGLIYHRSLAASVGGSLHRGPMTSSGQKLALAAIARNGVATIEQTGLRASVEQRWQRYVDQAGGRPIKAFVNVGGSQVSTGGSSFRDLFTPGLQKAPAASQDEGHGLLARMHEAGISTIHIDEVTTLAERYGLPVSPSHTPVVGEGGPFHDWVRIRVAAGVAAVVLGLALVAARLLVLAPAGQDEFDPYFGNGGFALRRRLKMLVGRSEAA